MANQFVGSTLSDLQAAKNQALIADAENALAREAVRRDDAYRNMAFRNLSAAQAADDAWRRYAFTTPSAAQREAGRQFDVSSAQQGRQFDVTAGLEREKMRLGDELSRHMWDVPSGNVSGQLKLGQEQLAQQGQQFTEQLRENARQSDERNKLALQLARLPYESLPQEAKAYLDLYDKQFEFEKKMRSEQFNNLSAAQKEQFALLKAENDRQLKLAESQIRGTDLMGKLAVFQAMTNPGGADSQQIRDIRTLDAMTARRASNFAQQMLPSAVAADRDLIVDALDSGKYNDGRGMWNNIFGGRQAQRAADELIAVASGTKNINQVTDEFRTDPTFLKTLNWYMTQRLPVTSGTLQTQMPKDQVGMTVFSGGQFIPNIAPSTATATVNPEFVRKYFGDIVPTNLPPMTSTSVTPPPGSRITKYDAYGRRISQ